MLNTLNLFGCNIGLYGLMKLSEVLMENKTIKELNIGFNQLQGAISAEKICIIIANCKNIEELDVSRNKFGQRGLSLIFDAICEYEQENRCHLKKINISQCNVNTFCSSLDLYHPVILDRIKYMPL